MKIDYKNLKGEVFKFSYDTKRFYFKKLFEEHFQKIKIKNIEKIHIECPRNLLPNEIVGVMNDQSYGLYEYMYKIDNGYSPNKERSNFLKLYDSFISYIKEFHFDNNSIIYQSKPTLRIHLQGNKAVGGFHRDREYNHPIDEINFWLPITKSKNTSTIWIEDGLNTNKYKSWDINYGEYIIFDSGLMHGNKVNTENLTRVSFDFRIIEKNLWNNKQKNNTSILQKIKFDIGEYYHYME